MLILKKIQHMRKNSSGVISLLSSHNIPDNLSEIGVEYVEVRHSLHCSDCVLRQNLNFIC